MEPLLIRRLETTDADDIGGIYASIIQKPVGEDFKQLIERHARREDDACFVAEMKGRVVGFMISYILTMGFGINKSAWIATLGVNPDYMGEGIGAQLAQKVMEYYKSVGVEDVYTAVRWDSTDLLSFFKTLGFDRSNFVNLRKKLS